MEEPVRDEAQRALKIARAVASAKGLKKRTRFLALENSFHGRTVGAVATTHTEKYRKPFVALMPGVTKDVMDQPAHQWIKGLSAEQRTRIHEFYEKRYGENVR